MVLRRLLRPATVGALLFLGADGVALAQRQPSLAPLSMIERGQWQLKGTLGGDRKICFVNPTSFIQIEHSTAQCQQFVMAEDQRSATVRYTCTGHGHGRTVITVETPRVVRIETQGVADGAPFEQEYEARKVGTCG